MAARLTGRRGCLAAAIEPLGWWKARSRRRRAGDNLSVSWERTAAGAVGAMRFEIDAPASRVAELADALAALVAEGASSTGLTVGCVGIVPDEEPVLVALAPRHDLVATRFRDALRSGATHRRPNLWLTLSPGTYLASVVDPFRPFAGELPEVLALVRGGRSRHALASRLEAGPHGVRITIELYASRPELRRLLSLGRKGLRELPGWSAASQTAPPIPSTRVKTRLQR